MAIPALNSSWQEETSFLQLLQKKTHGKLKVYMGMAPGVGKTYRMLQEAHLLLQQGMDVCIGYVETHGRQETEALVHGLPVLPLKELYYQGRLVRELDIQSVLNRKPEVVLIDELPHTNAPGSRNAKRWQDVEQLLQAGVSVITAMNIQHLESLTADVARITGLEIAERVPDGFLNLAHEVVNVDLTASDLIDRLKAGKIYKLNKLEQALANFFQEEKLLQLRELSLREVARQLDRQLDVKMPTATQGLVLEKAVLCISTNHASAKAMIRKMARLITGEHAEWWVVYVQTPAERSDQVKLSIQRSLYNNMTLAQEMGAKVATLRSDNFEQAMYNFLGEQKISLCALGATRQPFWKKLWGGTPADKLMNMAAHLPVDFLIMNAHES